MLQRWTKGFDIPGVEGHDVAAQLRGAIAEQGIPVELVCVVNDTVGALVASAYGDAETVVGAIFGTGCNAAYMARVAAIGKLRGEDGDGGEKGDGKMAINCEYGAFDPHLAVLPQTAFDRQIDAESPRPGQQLFEKMSAGLYLGEIYRLVLLDLATRGLIFAGSRGKPDSNISDGTKNGDTNHQEKKKGDKEGESSADKLSHPYSITTAFLCTLEEDSTPNFSRTKQLFHDVLAMEDISDADIAVSRRVAEMIAVRGARLCACGVAAICEMEGITRGHVAADGSVANKHPQFKRRWARALGEILGWEGKGKRGEDPIVITSAEDGSGVGCAIVVAMEMERRRAVEQ